MSALNVFLGSVYIHLFWYTCGWNISWWIETERFLLILRPNGISCLQISPNRSVINCVIFFAAVVKNHSVRRLRFLLALDTVSKPLKRHTLRYYAWLWLGLLYIGHEARTCKLQQACIYVTPVAQSFSIFITPRLQSFILNYSMGALEWTRSSHFLRSLGFLPVPGPWAVLKTDVGGRGQSEGLERANCWILPICCETSWVTLAHE